MDALPVHKILHDGVEAWFSNPIKHFAGKAICGDPETINGIVMDKTDGDEDNLLPSMQSFHPKSSGTTLYAQSMNETIGSMGL